MPVCNLPIPSLLRKQESSAFFLVKSVKSRWISVFSGMTFIFVSTFCFALETPHYGKLDKRVRHINYQAEQVVKLVGHYGFATDIAFAQGETIKQIAVGDSEAWSVTPVANHIFIKPKAEKAITNMTVLTSQRIYNFELSAHWSQHGAHPHPNDMMFAIDFRYPALAQQHKQQAKLKHQLNSESVPQVVNQNYFYKGNRNIVPIQAFDDGRFSYLTFNRKQDLPAIYIINADNSESLVNTHVDPNYPDTVIVERVVRQIVLRQGNTLACVFNQSFQQQEPAQYQTSNIPHVNRKIKGGMHE
ncbi:P-type conjugative transfer protein VirB9 [Shewanella sp. 202IG2-18]|uniref:P-type conjugative transfer protein VirB9 n=1 Tax=Parashewanella hymeniacidonis TaxID=2807618 RepID=UPI0019612B7C|nr:P-type conjugative transfer protein VirB9 [Parashewanella hymeniacidonis]MBM7070731.1 P-type conjugative transfer protein VirB9 [Parashewanella hymeniacidonis]